MDLQIAQKRSREPFVNQDPAMLRIVGEFDDVISRVLTFDQVSLSTAPHLPNQISSSDRHSEEAMSQSVVKASQDMFVEEEGVEIAHG